jgi:5-methylthioadenosine/S-adenosylhomocysteine deaminase
MTQQLLTGATVVTMNPDREVIQSGAVLLNDDRIADVGPAWRLEGAYPRAAVVSCDGGVLIPGLVNTHTHLFQTLLKGLGDDRRLAEWFSCMTGPGAAALTADDCQAAAVWGGIEALTTGTTTLVDFMYAHPLPHLADAVYQGLTQVGIRAFVARGYLTVGDDSGVPPALIEKREMALADAERLISTHNKPGARVQVALGPCMIWTVDEATLRETRALADAAGALVTMHLAETDFEIENSWRRFGESDTAVLERTGLLGPDLLAVHCVQCTGADLSALRAHDVRVSHNPCSNLYLASGIAPVADMLRRKLVVSLATDGPASNNNHSMLQVLKFAALTQKGLTRDPEIISAERVLEMATIDGAAALGLRGEIGSIEPGKRADLVLLRFDNPCVNPLHHVVSALVYSARGDEVDTVWVDGVKVVGAGRVTLVDQEAACRAAQRAADGLVDRAALADLRHRPWRSLPAPAGGG